MPDLRCGRCWLERWRVCGKALIVVIVAKESRGSFKGLVSVPKDVELGQHTLQFNAAGPDGAVRSLSLGVVLQASKVTARKVAKATVMFPSYSAVLSANAKATLLALAKKVGPKASAGMVLGYAQRGGNYAKNQRLSVQRANVVAKFLKRQGVKATLVARGNGVLDLKDTARKAVVTLSYTP